MAALTAAACTSVAGCGWMFPDDRDLPDGVRDRFDGLRGGCAIDSGAVRLGATAAEPGGGAGWQLWVAEGDPLGAWVIVPLDEDGLRMAAAGCMPQRVADEELSSIGGLTGNGVALYAGRIPDDAVEIRFDDGPTIAVEDDGFFLVAIEGELESRRTIEALDPDGVVIAAAETM